MTDDLIYDPMTGDLIADDSTHYAKTWMYSAEEIRANLDAKFPQFPKSVNEVIYAKMTDAHKRMVEALSQHEFGRPFGELTEEEGAIVLAQQVTLRKNLEQVFANG